MADENLSLFIEEIPVAAPLEAPVDRPKKRKAAASEALPASSIEAETSPVHSALLETTLSQPVLVDSAAVRERAAQILGQLDPELALHLPADLPFSPEDDPFTQTAEGWEQQWYSARESAGRVYLNMRMEFRQQWALALAGEPNDLKPWTYWVFHGVRPAEDEPVHGLTAERRQELGWVYPGTTADFRIYRAQETDAQ